MAFKNPFTPNNTKGFSNPAQQNPGAIDDYLVVKDIKMSMGGGVPPGTIVMFAGSNVPSGWLLCNGSAVSRTRYAALYSAIGNTWGAGNGSSTFNLPELINHFPYGADPEIFTLGANGGSTTHYHSITDAYTGPADDLTYLNSAGGTVPVTPDTHGHIFSANTDSESTLPPYQAVYFIIKI